MMLSGWHIYNKYKLLFIHRCQVTQMCGDGLFQDKQTDGQGPTADILVPFLNLWAMKRKIRPRRNKIFKPRQCENVDKIFFCTDSERVAVLQYCNTKFENSFNKLINTFMKHGTNELCTVYSYS